MIRVLVVDDSPVARELLMHILDSDADIEVIGSAANGREAVDFVARDKPDLITMDIHMPVMDGFEASRTIMETTPVPIVIVTASYDMRELETSFQAIETGALTVLQKPLGIGHPDHERNARNLIATVKLMSEIKVVRRWFRTGQKRPQPQTTAEENPVCRPWPVKVVAVGASTGGPPVIEKLLAALPKEFPAPILIVQHMAEGFIHGFAEWLGQTSSLPVHVPFHGSMTRSGHVYIAPDGNQMKMGASGRICCICDQPENGLRPSVSYLFRSVAETFGRNAVGVLLTGMGKDGSAELKLMKDRGAVTIAQNEESSAVYGMPGEAVKLHAAHYVLPAERIAGVLTSVVMPGITSEDSDGETV
ncbi:chemotaxis-specific protein-glutamate methyltransferase CheB [Desulfoprunum benzoelyticum]|uniref:Protein-glutamate methylesterase/protein-glutamine glutaminase n=1 Tax=Desulfoprunum benzoelyticum TaxID=1506996 RepID=A0A840UZ25_9BACT|nr:chemotaxis-specific protein-glutamate methyltransferase CheB [Desulfoprunum benzoelyticum]MBB5347908.1 two-component system chemotaxis response regulator CheB [Desulfoprunum benzoelyticum]MBM9530335.1 chemotaxis-specific protein-glutamate methyltransferase CheB [Desulfoprunum benzoelyticum]